VEAVVSWLRDRVRPGIGLAVLAALTTVTIIAGGVSILHSVRGINHSLVRLEAALGTANASVDALNHRMNAIGRMDADLARARTLTDGIGGSVARSRARIRALRSGTAGIDAALARVASSTDRINGSLQGIDSQTGGLATSVAAVGRTITPLIGTNRALRRSVTSMRSGVSDMNGSLRYVIRVLDYMTAPPGGGPFSIDVRLDPALIPKVKGLTVTSAPIEVFRRGQWRPYTGP
jgi:hypothetical protein